VKGKKPAMETGKEQEEMMGKKKKVNVVYSGFSNPKKECYR
jgi:hypothetical protein